MEPLALVALGVLPTLVIVAAISDLTTMTIPNWISGLLVLGFFPAALLVGLPWVGIATHVGVGLIALIVGMALFALRWLGGGDAKLIAACALWMGLSGSAAFVLWMAVLGGGLSILLLVARARLGEARLLGPAWSARLLQPKGDVPYGVAVAAGALMAFPASPLFLAFMAK